MENLEEKKRELRELVEHFKHNVKEKQIEKYDETDTRIEFINKFFKLLGWDVDNEKKRPIEERQVVSEDKVSISGKQKSPDYGFYIKGKLRFFVEAKKPSVNIKYDVGPAFQVRRYGYSARLPISILTDFEEFAIYDTRIKPNQNDDTSVARVDYFTLDEYEEKFAELLKNISPAAIEGGSFDEYTDEIKNKKGTSEVDKELLKSIESWREKLAKNITLRNDDLKLHEINLAVQKIIDRIIFLRIAEDKEIEDYETLLNATKNENIYKNLNAVFIQANKKYNAGLFMPVEYLDNLSIDDNVLKDIIKGLYYPESPYEFSVLPIEILGSIYEQFLGKTIRFRGVRGGRQTAIIEEKPEVKKAGGVYYTPQYIVRYIIEQTLLKKIKSKTPKQIKNLTVLDPACGSGSFLVQVYETLLDYYLNFYSDEKNVKQALKEEKIFEVPNTAGIKEYRLKIEEKKEILLRHIYGVDIDEQAVEVTKLSLCLKLLENESSETRNMLFRYSDLKVLPDLSNNIKSGNSLVGNDYYDDNNLILLDLEAMRKINVFDWETEFPEIFKAGGFDVILGNPPYVNVELLDSDTKTYLFSNYKTCKGRTDMYIAFIEKALSLLKQNGEFSFIIPYAYTNQNYAELSRKLLIEKYSVQEIVDTANYQVF
ncbi:MAG: Eco57I restriction-modification methylase domain-containing protein [Candidatus Kapaibacterium sp.]